MSTIRLGSTPGLDLLQVSGDPGLVTPGVGEICVRIKASSLNGHDYAVAVGRLPSAPGRILLADGAGTVESVGPDVVEFAPGDSVISGFFPTWLDGPPLLASFAQTPGDGVDGFATKFTTRRATAFTHAPRGYTMAESGTLTTAAVTAWRALFVEGALKPGETVLVLGSGGVSIFALQFAKALGAQVIGTSSSDEKLEKLRALGADHVINYRKTPDWGQAVRDLTSGRGVDHVVEVGGPATLPQSITATRIGGHIALIGVLTGISGQIPTAAMMARQQRLVGITVGSRRHQQDMVRALNNWKLRPVIDREFEVKDLADALRYQETGNHLGKIAIRMA